MGFGVVEPAMSRLLGVMAAFALGAIAGTACSGGASPAAIPSVSARPGVIAGTYLVRNNDGSEVAPIKGQSVGAFQEQFLPGTPRRPRHRPVARAETTSDGTFAILGLGPGRYFVAPADPAPPFLVVGRWVTLRAGRGASVRLFACRDCPPPA